MYNVCGFWFEKELEKTSILSYYSHPCNNLPCACVENAINKLDLWGKYCAIPLSSAVLHF